MTREFKVGDRVVAEKRWFSGEGIIVSDCRDEPAFDWRVEFERGCKSPFFNGELTHAEPVPIGYTGKLRDMDLHEGDVVQSVKHGTTYEVRMVAANKVYYKSGGYDHSDGQLFTLISRANTAPTPTWSDWQLSRKDGTMSQQYAEVHTVALDDTDQVVYRGRGEPVRREVMTVSVAIVDGQPDWDTVEEVVL